MQPELARAAGRLTVVALLVAAAGFVLQMVSGVTNTPTIPPGLVLILGAAGLVAWGSGPAVALAGPAGGLFNLAVFVGIGAADRLTDARPATAFAGAWIMVGA